MSSIESMSFNNIRNFVSNETNKIAFSKNITVLFGKNGVGKSSVVECLKSLIFGINSGKESVLISNFTNDRNPEPQKEASIHIELNSFCGMKVCLEQFSFPNQNSKHEKYRFEYSITLVDQQTLEYEKIPYNSSQFFFQVSQLTGISKVLANNIVFGQNKDYLGTTFEGGCLKELFNDIFDTQKFNQFLNSCQKNLSRKQKELDTTQEQLKMKRKLFETNKSQVDSFFEILQNLKKSRLEIENFHEIIKKAIDFEQFEKTKSMLVELSSKRDKEIKKLTFISEKLSELGNWNWKEFFSKLLSLEFGNLYQMDLQQIVDSFHPQSKEADEFEIFTSENEQKRLFRNDEELLSTYTRVKSIIDFILSSRNKINDLLESVNESIAKLNVNGLKQEFFQLMERLHKRHFDKREELSANRLIVYSDDLAKYEKETNEKLNQTFIRMSNLILHEKNHTHFLNEKIKKLKLFFESFKQNEISRKMQTLKLNLSEEKVKLQNLKASKIEIKTRTEYFQETLASHRHEIELYKKQTNFKKYTDTIAQFDHLKSSIVAEFGVEKSKEEVLELVKHVHKDLESKKGIQNTLKSELMNLFQGKKVLQKNLEETIQKRKEGLSCLKWLEVDFADISPYQIYKNLEDDVRKSEFKIALMKYSVEELLPTILENSLEKNACFLCHQRIGFRSFAQIKNRFEDNSRLINEHISGECCTFENKLADFEKLSQVKDALKEDSVISEKISEFTNSLNDLKEKENELSSKLSDFEEEIERHKQRLDLYEKYLSFENKIAVLNELDKESVSEGELIKSDLQIKKIQQQEREFTTLLNIKSKELVEIKRKIDLMKSKIGLLEDELKLANEDSNLTNGRFSEFELFSLAEIQNEIEKTRKEMECFPSSVETQNSGLNFEKEECFKTISLIKQCTEKAHVLKESLNDHSLQEKKRYLEEKILTFVHIEKKLNVCFDFINLEISKRKVGSELEDTVAKILESSRQIESMTREKKQFDELYKKSIQSKTTQTFYLEQIRKNAQILKNCQLLEDDLTRQLAIMEFQQKVVVDLENIMSDSTNSLKSFHFSKITELNEQINEVWKEGYRHTDIKRVWFEIDYFCEKEFLSDGFFEYKLMFENSFGERKKLDRNVSSGQMLMISIAVRIAISGMFCKKFPLVVLDEPTCFLDQHNSEMLGNYLKKLFSSKEFISNFQFVIISNDEKFLSILSSENTLFYEIIQDESGISTIRHKVK